jgi:hypothetical protein
MPIPKLGNLFPRKIWRVLESWEYENETGDPGIITSECYGIVLFNNKFCPIFINRSVDYLHPETSFECDTVTHYKYTTSVGDPFGESSFWTKEEATNEVINRIRKVISQHEHNIDKISAP